jgi:hypothetical protein
LKRTFYFPVLLIILSILLASCEKPAASTAEDATVAPVPLAWIDSPLDGMHLQPGAYQVIAHGSDPAGIDQMEISVNGIALVKEPGAGTDRTLVTLTRDWNPTQPGEYVIQVRAGRGEVWSLPAQVTVWIDLAIPLASATVVLRSSATPSPTSTPEATRQSAYLKDVSISPKLVSQFTSCANREITAEVHAFDPDGITELGLYYRLQDVRSGDLSDWVTADLPRVQGDLYRFVFIPAVSGNPLFEFVSPRLEREGDDFAALIQIQFVMRNAQNVLLRSEVYSSVTLKGCVP